MSVRGPLTCALAVGVAAGAGGCGRLGFDPEASECAECYRLTIEPATYDAATAACAARGEHLVTIADAGENQAAFEYAATIPFDPVETTNHRSIMWMGAEAVTGETEPASWHWETGEPMSYSNWRAGEPNPGEHCLVMLGAEDGLWDNRPCDYAFGYLCERPAPGQ